VCAHKGLAGINRDPQKIAKGIASMWHYKNQQIRAQYGLSWDELLREWYQERKWSIHQIATRTPFSTGTVQNDLELLGIPRRPRGGNNNPTGWQGRFRQEYTFNGITDSLSGWAKRYGFSYSTLYGRLKKGWTFQKTVTTPSQRKKTKRSKNRCEKLEVSV
jgi:hypothetical protein